MAGENTGYALYCEWNVHLGSVAWGQGSTANGLAISKCKCEIYFVGLRMRFLCYRAVPSECEAQDECSIIAVRTVEGKVLGNGEVGWADGSDVLCKHKRKISRKTS